MQLRQKTHVESRPLAVDLDGTLIRSDLGIESVLQLLSRNIFYLFVLPFWLTKGKAYFKAEVARRVDIDVKQLPYNPQFLDFLKEEKAKGRALVLATASHEKYARAVAAYLGIFTDVIASDSETNMKSAAKRAQLEARFGRHGFDYAGNSKDDVDVFGGAHDVFLVGPDQEVEEAARASGSFAAVFDERRLRWRTYLEALRVHQWLKNGLVFVPLLLDHRILDAAGVASTTIAFLAFCFCASSVYILNDLVDLQEDRRHPSKHRRPFAAGTLPLAHGLILAPMLLAAAIGITLLLPPEFGVVLAVYYSATLAYSFFLKRTLLFDVITLAGLYMMRIVAGSAALSIPRSVWLLAFSVFLFFSFALVKRYVELRSVSGGGKLAVRSRGYVGIDRETLSQFGISSGLIAVLVLALYIDSNVVKSLYTRPEIIWLLLPLVLYLVTRIWLLARRDDMPDDPVMFAVFDWRSQIIIGLGVLLLLIASL